MQVVQPEFSIPRTSKDLADSSRDGIPVCYLPVKLTMQVSTHCTQSGAKNADSPIKIDEQYVGACQFVGVEQWLSGSQSWGRQQEM
jgi:hypothetical protein